MRLRSTRLGFWKSKLDQTLDGAAFPKSIEVVYVGMRTDASEFATFKKSRLDGNWDYAA
jgi:hypothetical protein